MRLVRVRVSTWSRRISGAQTRILVVRDQIGGLMEALAPDTLRMS
jgi:hypothetical protein